MHRCHSQTALSRNEYGQVVVDRSQAACTCHGIFSQKPTRRVTENRNLANEAYILRLPDELLMLITEITTYDNRSESPWAIRGCIECKITCDYSCTTALSLVCRRFARITQPFVFRVIGFKWPQAMMPPSSKVRSLFHVLQGNSSLRAPIKCIFLYVPDHEIEGQKVANFRILKNILQGLTNLRCLNIHGGFKAKVSNEQMFTILRNMPCASPHVEHLVLNREAWGLYLKDITNNIQFPRLRSLQVHGISKYKGDLTLDPKVYRLVLRYRDLSIFLHVYTDCADCFQKLHTASFTSLTLSDYEESPQATALLLSWPKNLEHFNFGSFYNNRYTMDYAMFTWWLSIHCETLKSVAIGYLSWHSSFRVFDATRFPNLEILKLSPHAMAVDLEFRDSARKILGPKVRTFGWDFSMNDQHSEGWTAFGEREDLWIRELAKAAKAQKAALVEIEITFTPDHWTLKREWGYPWDRMIRVRDDIAALNGISLSWNKPTLTREGWLEELERQEEPEQHLTIDEHLIESIPMAVEREPESSTESSGEEDFDAFEPFQPNCDIRDYFRHVERTQ